MAWPEHPHNAKPTLNDLIVFALYCDDYEHHDREAMALRVYEFETHDGMTYLGGLLDFFVNDGPWPKNYMGWWQGVIANSHQHDK